MYEFIEGRIGQRLPGRLVLEVGGIGYDIAVPLSARFADSGSARAWTHLVVREDAHLLYGFPDRAGRELFRLLLGVQRVGPAVALALVSQLERRELLNALASGDSKRLQASKGVGRKLAEQLVLDLREKAAALLLEERAQAGSAVDERTRASRDAQDAVAALVSIGYAEKDARRAVEAALEAARAAGEPLELEALVRQALAQR